MAYTLQQKSTDFRGGKNILASEHVQYVHGGATLDAEAFGEGYIELGTLIARNKDTGKYEPFEETEGFDNFFIMNEDADCDGENDMVTGAVIIAGSVYEAKLPEEPSDDFKEKTPNIFYVTHEGGDTPS